MNDNQAPVKAWEIIGLIVLSAVLAVLVVLPYLALEVKP